MKVVIRLSLALAALTSPAFATPKSDVAAIEKHLKACIDKDGSNVGMKMCTGDAYEAADKVLNRIYSATVTILKKPSEDQQEIDDGKEKLKRLVASERAWISFRDTQCELQGIEMLGGTGESLTIVGCELAMTEERIKAVEDIFGDK